ncbi:MAG: ATP-binding cassette domain-containing protein, partial [Deferrisomatales bacterium]
MAELLELHGVTAGYEDTVVLEEVSLAVGNEQSWAVLGRNGVGKTTLLATIMGLTVLRAGRLAFDGADLTRTSTWGRARLGLGYVPQEREIFPSLTV